MNVLARHEAKYFGSNPIACGEFQMLWKCTTGKLQWAVDWVNREDDDRPAITVVPMGPGAGELEFVLTGESDYQIEI